MKRLVCFLNLLFAPYLLSAQTLPDPLNLSHAMKLADDMQYFRVLEAQAALKDAQAMLETAESEQGLRAQIEIEGAYIEPNKIAFDQSNNDSRVSLRIMKPVYDFGGSVDRILAASDEQLAIKENMAFILAQQKLDIARQFFNVILSDLKFAWDNEAMATAFVRFEASKDRHALSQISDVELLEAENKYLNILHERSISESNQRHSRALLAEVINKPGNLPSNLVMPSFDFSSSLPEYSVLLESILQQNPQIKLAEVSQQAAAKRMQAEDKQFHPKLNAEIEVSEYARDAGSYEDWGARLNLVIPIYEDASIKSNISKARSVWLKKRAALLNIQMQVRRQVLHLWQTIEILSKRRQQLRVSQDFRELNLDKSRALYEMEVKTDLGNSLVAISEINYLQAKNEFELALAWMQLRLLVGKTDLLTFTL